MRVAFLGNDPWSVPSLESLVGSRHEVALVATRVPRPAGRGRAPRPTAVAEAARRLSVPLAEVGSVKSGDGFEAIRAAAPEALVVVAYGEILPADVLDLPSVASVNVHFSLLPALRGANPVARAILEGYATTGVTTMRMDEGMDTGPVLLQRPEAIGDEDDAGSLGERLARIGGAILVETLDGLEAGTLEERAQDESQATMAPRFRTEEEWVDWTADAEGVWRQIRALAPEPGARTRFRGRTLKLLRARPVAGRGEPGTMVSESGQDIAVAAGSGAILLLEVIPEGKRRMPAADFARGARPKRGERLLGPEG
jgi:methionyl-tRNA formyltransferase